MYNLQGLEEYPELAQAEALKQVAIDIYKNDLYSFSKYITDYNEMDKDVHLPVCQALSTSTTRKLIVLPRGTFKSSVANTAYCAWRIVRDPNIRILIDSEVYSNSKNFLRELKAKLDSRKFTDLFGTHRGDTWNEGEIIVSTRTRAFREATVTCGGVETTKVGQHYDLIIFDDLNSKNNSDTQEGRQKVIDHYRMNEAILEPNGTMVVIGTRYAEDDLIGWIIRNELGYKNETELRKSLRESQAKQHPL